MLYDNDNDNDNFHDDDNLVSHRTLTDLNEEDVGEYNYLTMMLKTMTTTKDANAVDNDNFIASVNVD